jgi:hypothetical protein
MTAQLKAADVALFPIAGNNILQPTKLAHKWTELIKRLSFQQYEPMASKVYWLFACGGIVCPEVSIQDDCFHFQWIEENRKITVWIDHRQKLTLYTTVLDGTGGIHPVTLVELEDLIPTLHTFAYGEKELTRRNYQV